MNERIAFLSLMVCGLSLIGLSGFRTDPTFLYNRTESAPIGWYRIEQSHSYSIGDRVASRLPNQVQKLADERRYLPPGSPVIKTIFAGPGDTYCVRVPFFSVGDHGAFEILTADSQGRKMPALVGGCRSLKAGEYVLLSKRSIGSFDSLYFGPVNETDIIGKAVWIGKYEASKEGKGPKEGGARGSGAEDKIKAPCTKPVLSLCLHINLGCTKILGLAPRVCKITNPHWGGALHHFTKRHDLSSSYVDG